MTFRLQRHPQNPVLLPEPASPWECYNVFNPSVIHHGGLFHMHYRAQGLGLDQPDRLCLGERGRAPLESFARSRCRRPATAMRLTWGGRSACRGDPGAFLHDLHGLRARLPGRRRTDPLGGGILP